MDGLPFYGRSEELKRLQDLTNKKVSSLVVIKGRRRIGKSRLIFEFSKEIKTYVFTGLPPTKETTPQMQRNYFATQMERQLSLKAIKTDDWDHLFWHLAQKTTRGQVLVVLDEINWMGSLDPTFLGKLKSAWDLYFKNNPRLLLILSGSMSSWIDDNILSSTGFMGRISLELTLEELPLSVCNKFWRNKPVSSYEKFKILSVTGGVPRYLEEIDPNKSAEENIQNLAFKKGGILVEEFDRIFSDLFSRKSDRYKSIVKRLIEGSATLDQIARAVKLEKGGTLSEYLEDLEETGYISKDPTWNLKDGKESNLCRFRLKDNYLRYYLKYIEPNKSKIQKNRITLPPAWFSIMGIQFENLVLNNSKSLFDFLKLNPNDIVFDNPYFQRATKTYPSCQVDYLIQDKFNTLYLFEIKFSKEPIKIDIIKEVKEKIKKIYKPKNFSIRPILIHVNGIDEAVVESDFFASVIDFSQFLSEEKHF